MRGDLEMLMATAATIRDSAAADRRKRDRDRLQSIAGDPERPVEISRRGNSLTSIADLMAAIAPPSKQTGRDLAPSVLKASPAERLEQLERELAQLLAAAAPSTWSAHRRPLARVLRHARRELRAAERLSPSIT